MIFCTLFDSNYLDKGIVLINSLNAVCENVRMYVLALDDICYEILNKLNLKNVVVIKRTQFVEIEDLVSIQNDRSAAEFCWTCTSHLIDYVIRYCNEKSCTYVDADCYFYKDPQILLLEMKDKSVQIVEHRFTNSIEDKISKKESGTYCVEFNTFTDAADSLELLDWWKSRCKESCSNSSEDSNVFGDQMYLENWGSKHFVSVLKNLGGGVAPWNIAQYKFVEMRDNSFVLQEKKTKREFELIFYHFHNLSYLDENSVSISVYQRAWGIDDRLVNEIYLPYLKKLKTVKEFLQKEYGLSILIKRHPAFINKEKKKSKTLVERLSNKKLKDIFITIYLYTNAKLKNWFVKGKDIISF